ncbi:hypothetical protein [Niveibacterium sp. SC-1]|uniref:hypothetical protein n=1 Tax=Niveibacterium sp. SC-1 TaxID=3135646 RepID=UPI00311EBBBE
MPIRIAQTPEPMSERSLTLGADAQAILADSDATLVLREDLRRYCQGQVRGRSFLIAGHRGAGKTTLVNNAILEVWRDSERGLMPLRPLFVPLHGPNLFPPMPAASKGKRTPGPVIATAAGEAEKPAKSEAQIALEQITLGLHRAAAREFVQRFWAHVDQDEASASRALSELAAQFETELYESPTPARLREFWARAGGLEEGVLARRFGTAALAQRPRQAMRELAALSGIVEAYRRISGDYKRTEKSGEKRARSIALEARSETSKELTKPLAALATGVLAGAGALSAAASPLAVVGSGIVAALGSAAVFKLSSSRSSTREQSREDSFIFDLSVATLDRVLPTLVDRLRDAGLAPVFVVDELDKVDGLSTRIIAMVHHLKKLVAENAFFCFLTDRGYFEDLRLSSQQRAYDVAYSYFSQRLLIAFSPDELDVYLSRLFTTTSAPASSSAASPSQRQADDDIDRELLPWVLRQRAALHPLALQREIAAIRDGDQIRLRPGEVRSRKSFLIDVTLQMGIEFTLAQPTVQQWLAQRSEMRQVLFDALYYASREWRDESTELDLSLRGRAAFVKKLNERMNLRDTRAAGAAETPAISEIDADFLLSCAQLLAAFIARDRLPLEPEPATADWRIEQLTQWARPPTGGQPGAIPPRARQVAQSVLDALLVDVHSTLLVPHPDEEHRYAWRYWSSGDLRRGVDRLYGLQPAFLVEVNFQAAIEYLLAQPAALALGADKPWPRVRLRDALGYPLRLWRQGQPHVALNPIGRAGFKTDVVARGQALARECGQPAPDTEDERFDALFELLGELVELLACEEAPVNDAGHPVNRFRAWVTGLQAAGPNATPRKLAGEYGMLVIGHMASVLQPAQKRTQVYRFRYDRGGQYLVPAERRLESAAAHVRQTHEAGWRRDADFITAMDKGLAAMLGVGAEAGRGGVFNVLAEQYRVLPTTPAWTFVVSALVRLEQSQQRGAEPAAEDAAVVAEFRAMLEGSSLTLARSLVCARFLAATVPGQRLREALWALARGLRFAERNANEISGGLDTLADTVARRFEPTRAAGDPAEAGAIDSEGLTLLQGLVGADSIARYWSTLKAVCERADKLGQQIGKDPWRKIVAQAWRECRYRLLAWFKRDAREPLELHELLCLVATNTGPALRVEPELEQMRLVQWSDALYEAMQPGAAGEAHAPPAWLGAFALRGLSFAGLGMPAAEPLLNALAAGNESWLAELRQLAEELRFYGQFTPGTFLIVRRAQASCVENWLPDREVFCVALHHWQLENLLTKEPGGLLSALPAPRCVIWEQPADSLSREETLRAGLWRLWASDAPLPEFGLHSDSPRGTPPYHPIVAPMGPGDIVSATYSK